MMFRVIGISVLAAFYGCYFAKMIHQKRQGIRTDQMGRGKTGTAKFVEITLKAATMLVPVVELACIMLDISALPDWARIIGIFLGVSGTAAFILSVLTMKGSWRAGVPENHKTALVTSGIYQISRNPAFLGFDLVYIGILLMFFNWVLLACSVFAMVMFHLQIVCVEERFLSAAFGEEYLAYRRSVNRYIGRKRI